MRQAARRRRVVGHNRQHIVIGKLGGQPRVQRGIDAIHVHQIGVEQEHKRRFHHAGMFQIPTREAIGIKFLDGGIVNKIPVGQKLNLYVSDALGRRLLESQLGAFEDKLVVLDNGRS
mgnify:CR=1 FL=1